MKNDHTPSFHKYIRYERVEYIIFVDDKEARKFLYRRVKEMLK